METIMGTSEACRTYDNLERSSDCLSLCFLVQSIKLTALSLLAHGQVEVLTPQVRWVGDGVLDEFLVRAYQLNAKPNVLPQDSIVLV